LLRDQLATIRRELAGAKAELAKAHCELAAARYELAGPDTLDAFAEVPSPSATNGLRQPVGHGIRPRAKSKHDDASIQAIIAKKAEPR